ncbi:malto-oligosyltrehalose synthase [Sphingobacterium sp. SGR-19]|uniref:malto-oligosyltrehalose synthase n=1 Tax=Sphingobacterium sp. SGR-19 TaxID=2710886 RepID=UPI0013EA142B|nr:malto-oligosyltrehalose synthase [Sphingobacterium sp. SGR-19]NGM66934.1 malto-oligosyltrehalose synthase [Sphingobacterium sp. SGR-19]
MDIPRGTYRIQFNDKFTFQHLGQIVDYLHNLGVDTVYASPIFQATPGSVHGYDGTDPNNTNPEIGTLDQLIDLKTQLTRLGIKWLQDIVPNHMAFHHENRWLMDVLEYGDLSPYSTYFDTAHHGVLFKKGKLMVPILGKGLIDTVQSDEIKVVLDNQRFYFTYFDWQLPITPTCYDEINQCLANINDDKEKILDILSRQHYQLCHWTETDQRINYRRFFTINGLICLNVQDEDVFKGVHQFVRELLAKKIVDGLRIDHIDGLHNPTKYLRDLRNMCGTDTYIVAEKILEQGENLPLNWSIQGTTGYDFLALCNNVCTDNGNEKLLTEFYDGFIGKCISIAESQIEKKRAILAQHMQGEIDNLCQLFLDLGLDLGNPLIAREELRSGIEAFLVYFPIYRLYEESFPFPVEAYETIAAIFDAILQKEPDNVQGTERLRDVMKRAQYEPDHAYRKNAMVFFQRCMQFTGPVMAKGVEDTLMYTYNRFIGHNEVGDHPANFGVSVATFHDAMQKRQMHWPSTLNATATHDTKRGEDARARLLVLTAWPEAWIEQLNTWQKIVKEHYEGDLPHANDIYAIYQAIFGSYPMPGCSDDGFEDRFLNYLTKYLREGKEHSAWADPDERYEQRTQRFAQFLLDKERPFYPVFHTYLKGMVDFGIMNSLAQLLLKLTCPGVPDIYQGTELWDLSFVDPDNRRRVDYAIRQQYLQEIDELANDNVLPILWKERYNGKIKLWLMKTLLAIRNKYSSIFTKGEYVPLEVKGKYHEHILAFARNHKDEWLVVVVPLHLAAIEELRNRVVQGFDWQDTTVVLPNSKPVQWRHLLSPIEDEGTTLAISSVFKDYPLAVIRYSKPPNPRSAGVLLHITSLPSRSGIGDLGPGAYDFVQFLESSGQRWWQILPLGPTSQPQCHSPYSTRSAMAGNPLLISLEALADEGLLTQEELEIATMDDRGMPLDFAKVESIKRAGLHIAFERADPANDPNFKTFCAEEGYWLDDYALFVVLHDTFSDAPWYAWPERFKSRHPQALAQFEAEHHKQLLEEKWTQYTFFRQWKKLKTYCEECGVRILGDVPMYVGYDSADVWAHPHLFSLASDGSLQSVAGVPPDYFNAEGQLWGMPVYNWQALERDNYTWWMLRLARNCKLFDMVRLDHFRAFAAYWEVSVQDKTAQNGQWRPGPGKDFFTRARAELGKLPFIVEDLGDIDDAVYELRDAFQLPGTKVLQFAFGDNMASSPHIPHHYTRNFFAYTGTHDNNTILGWFNEEIDDAAKERLSQYTSIAADQINIADIMLKMAYASVADTVIVPLQDILSLPGTHRMNNPASTSGNWQWRAPHDAFGEHVKTKLRHYMELYDRI